jgi:RNA polymerase primary sigma factor
MSRIIGKTKPNRHKAASGTDLARAKAEKPEAKTSMSRLVQARSGRLPPPANDVHHPKDRDREKEPKAVALRASKAGEKPGERSTEKPTDRVKKGVIRAEVRALPARAGIDDLEAVVAPVAVEPEVLDVLEPEGDLVELAAVTAVEDTEDPETEREVDEVEAEESEDEQTEARRTDDEPASFLGMYFRDMAELDVLRPEQEFETARKIEEQELELWRTLLSFAPGASWISDAIEKAAGEVLPDITAYRLAAEQSRKKSSIPDRSRFEKEILQVSERLRKLDIDRIFADGAVAEVQRVGQAVALGHTHELSGISFSTTTKAFREYVRGITSRAVRLKQSKNEFVKANLRLVVSIARRFNHGRLPLADLIQEGNIGLMKAVERYDYRRGFRFSTYASWWIRHAISRALADKGRAVRLPVHMIDAYHRIAKSQRELQSKLDRPPTTDEIAAATGIELEKLEKMKTFLAETPVSLDRPLADGDGRKLIDVLVDPEAEPNVPEQMANSETQSEMLKLLDGLRPIEADILRKRFGLETDKERTLKEIGDEYRLSRERVRQLQEQALGKMRRAMAKRETV